MMPAINVSALSWRPGLPSGHQQCGRGEVLNVEELAEIATFHDGTFTIATISTPQPCLYSGMSCPSIWSHTAFGTAHSDKQKCYLLA